MRPSLQLLSSALFTVCLTVALGLVGCVTPPDPVPIIPDPPARDFNVAKAYPTLAEIYQGAQGIYRGCGPNGNVCHNSRQYPNMNTLGALSQIVNLPCNQLQDDPTRMDDWCERQGDTVRVGNQRMLLAYLQKVAERTETTGSRWLVVTRENVPAISTNTYLSIVRVRPGQSDDWLMGFDGRKMTVDPMRPNVVSVQLDLDDNYEERVLTRAGLPADRDAIQFGDPNRNGTFGVSLGNALVVPGHPEKSYLIRRLIDPSAGPLMPLANCCFWSKESLRALWCWIANLKPDGSNALDPIDYSVCPEGPVENVAYPEPGPTCQNGGLCPVHVRDPVPSDPVWANIYNNIVVPRCGGSGCHRSTSPAGRLDLGTFDIAYDQLLNSSPPRVVAGSLAMSSFYQRLIQPCDQGAATCRRMPLYQSALSNNELDVIARWIQMGARKDGMLSDAGVMDASTDAGDAGMMMTDVPRDQGTTMDTGPMDSGPVDSGPMDTGPADTGTDASDDAAAMDAGTD